MGSVSDLLYKKLIVFAAAFRSSISTFIPPFFTFIRTCLFRSSVSEKSMANPGENTEQESGICFEFKFPTYEEFSKNRGILEAGSSVNTSKYEFMSVQSYNGVIVEPKATNFIVEEGNTDALVGYSLDDEITERTHDLLNSNPLQENFLDEQVEKSRIGDEDGNSDETNKLETLWEHQELVEQLKNEVKKVRATGLPTILEETESSKVIMEDLRPWKIDENFHNENPMSDLHKFYKSYTERMRKFDILNYQKMYALGFVQLKDPLQSITTPKSPVFEFKSFLSQNFSPQRRKKDENDPTKKFVKELQSDLEVIYVGQMCLSWEFLHWQYGKSLDIWESDDHGKRKFNEVAGEFQQFQVLMQRFIEDEPFQGTRVQNYVKNRCLLRNLVQVPVIREDKLKDRKKAKYKEKNEYDITSDMLVEIIEESIRIFWKFVRADKDSTKDRREASFELQDPSDIEILSDVLQNLEKKERKLKDHLRSENCILKRLKKRKEEQNSDQVLYFFSQVDLRLVSRVLNMSRLTTEQLVWCKGKLGNISFVNRKIYVQPSFLLFPC